MIHRSDQDVQGSQHPPFSNTPIQQHTDLLTGRSAPINIPSCQPAQPIQMIHQWQAPAQPIQMIHRSDQDVQGSQRPPFSNTPIQQHADLLTGRSAPINIPSYQPAVVQWPHVDQGVLYYPPYVNIPHLECALWNVRLQ
jgi:hypothetical protein